MILLIALWVMVALSVFSLFMSPFVVGKPRAPLGPGYLVWVIAYSCLVIPTLLYVIFEVL